MMDGTVASSTRLNSAEGHVRVLLHDAACHLLHAATSSTPARLISLVIDSASSDGPTLRRLASVVHSQKTSVVSGMLDQGGT